jgi:hypothetical protein
VATERANLELCGCHAVPLIFNLSTSITLIAADAKT